MRLFSMRGWALLLVAVTVGTQTAQAQTWDCGVIPGTVTATLSGGTLTVSGSGAMKDYMANAPWYNSRNSIATVVIETGVTSIGSFAFYSFTSLATVDIPTGMKRIGQSAFYQCTRITSITIPDGVDSIGVGAFNGCTNLTSAGIPNSVTAIGATAFAGDYRLESINIPSNLKLIEMGLFTGCSSLTSVVIPNGVTSIGIGAFSGCSGLESVTIPEGVTKIGSTAFSGCASLTSIVIPNSVDSIGSVAFGDCVRLKSVTIPNGVTKIELGTFKGCTGLTSVDIPGSVLFIEGIAFGDCTALTSVTIPSSVNSMGAGVFMGCTNLRAIASLNPYPPSIIAETFSGIGDAVCLYAPPEYVAAYRLANYWRDFECIKSTDEYASITATKRVVPQHNLAAGLAVIAPTEQPTGLTVGPNPAGTSRSTPLRFFRRGKRIENGTLFVYDASGNVVNKVAIRDSAAGHNGKRTVGSWEFTDKNGRLVSEGTYLVKGTVKTADGKTEAVSVAVGVR